MSRRITLTGVILGAMTLGAVACSDRLTDAASNPIAHLVLTPITLEVGDTVSAAAIWAAAESDSIALARTSSWSSSDPSVVEVAADGTLIAAGPGSAQISALSGTTMSTSSISVSRYSYTSGMTVSVTIDSASLTSGETASAHAILRDSRGNLVTGKTIHWASTDTSVASVGSRGTVTARKPGTSSIVASYRSVSGSAPIAVATAAIAPAPVATVGASLAAPALTVGQTTQATATLLDATGAPLIGRAIVWSSSNATVASVSSSGLVTSLTAGSANVIATSETKSGSAAVSVTAPAPAPIATVSVSVASSTISVGQTTQATVSLLDASGKPTSGTVTWNTSNGNAAVSSSGLVTGTVAGSVNVLAAASNGVFGSKPLTVASPPPPTGTGILASHNFNDGTFGPYTLSFSQDIDIVDDPTGSGRGKVARMHYKGVDQDRNRSLVFTMATGIGQDMFFKGDFYIPANASTTNISRKLNYWQSEHWGSAPAFYSVMGMFGSEASNDNNYQKQDQSLDYTNNPIRRPSIGGIPGNGHYTFGVWHTLESQVNLGSKLGAHDGIFRQWLDGVLLYEETSKQWTDAAWTADPSTIHFYIYEVGDQVNGYNGVPFDEYRYWDNVSFGRKRLP